MSTEATLEPPIQTTPSEASRIANAFDARLKEVQTGVPAEPEAPIEPDKKDQTAPVDTEVVQDESDIPVHLRTSVEAKDQVVKDVEIESIPAPSKMNQATAGNWGKLRTLAETRGIELQRLQKELEAAKTAPKGEADPAIAESLKAAQDRAAALESELEKAAFERSDRYKELVSESNGAIANAKSYLDGAKTVEGEDVDPSIVDRAAAVTGVKRLNILKQAGLDPETVSGVNSWLIEHDKSNSKRDKALENHKQTLTQWESESVQEEQQKAQAVKAQEDNVFTHVLSRLEKTLPELKIIPGDDENNKRVSRIKEMAKNFYNGSVDIEGVADLSIRAFAYDQAAKDRDSLMESNKELKAKIKRLTAAQPNGGSSSTGAPLAKSGSRDDSREAVAARFDAALAGH